MLREDPIHALANNPTLGGTWDIVIVAPPPASFAALEADLGRHLHRVLWDETETAVLVVTDTVTRPKLPLPLVESKFCESVRLTLFETPQPSD